ncbi:MAG: ABC transporter substrate-binding protein [Oscillospiraceae bacterium]|nr:ABC transporter substrate-binding protein [Oscillospiraceae bacterium]
MKNRRMIALLISLVLCLALIAACTPAGTGTPGDGGQTGGTQGTQPPQAQPPAPQPGPETGGITPPDPNARYGGVMRLVTTAEGAGPIGLPWDIAANDVWFAAPAMETLFREYADGTIVPLLAEDWELDHDRNILVIHVRPNVYFHDGTRMNAEVAKWNLDMINEEGTPALTYGPIEVISEYVLEVYIPGGFANATVAAFAQTGFRMISMENFVNNGRDHAANNPVGTGPFIITEYVTGSHMRSVRNDNYWQPGLPYLDGVEYYIMGDVMTQTLALQSPHGPGSIDSLRTHNTEQVRSFVDRGYQPIWVQSLTHILVPSSDNPDSPFYRNPYLGRAISAAIDRDAIIAAQGHGVWGALYQLATPARIPHIPESVDPNYGTPRFDPDYARELLARGGFPDGFDTTLILQPGATSRDAIVAMQSMLADVGINASLEFPETGGWTTFRSGGWDGLIATNVINHVYFENTLLNMFSRGPDFYHSFYTSDELEALIQGSMIFGDNLEQMRAANAYMHDNGLIVPMWVTNSATIVRPGIHGLPTRNQFIWHAYVWFEWED